MANKAIDLSGLTFNPKEVDGFEKFIFQDVMELPDLRRVHHIQNGITMKEQIVLAGLFGKTGLKAGSSQDGKCGRPTSGAKSVLTEKFWEPVGIEDTLIHCNADMNSLFKAYFDKITKYREVYEFEPSDFEWVQISGKELDSEAQVNIGVFLMILFSESMQRTIWRAVWFGDTAVTVSTTTTAGLLHTDNEKFYDYFDGLWKQIFTAVASSKIKKVEIVANTINTSKEDQLVLPVDEALNTMKKMKAKASPTLKSNAEAQFLLSGELFENYTDTLTEKGGAYDINILQNGLTVTKWGGYDVINMATAWDMESREDFENNTTDAVYFAPHRAVMTLKTNVPIGTLNEEDFDTLEVWYNRDERLHKEAYGFSLDSKSCGSQSCWTNGFTSANS